MPRPRPIYLHRFRTRHKNFVWYVRKPGGSRIRLRAEYGTDEFEDQYKAAIAGLPATQTRPKAAAGTVAWLWERYRETGAWKHLAPGTRRARENIMVGVLAKIGAEKCTAIKRGHIVESREARADTPAQARNFLDTMRGLFRWALEAEKITIDPTAGVKNPARAKGDGFPVWTEDDVDAYQKKWKLGTKERVWLDVLLYTGLRRGDAVILGRQHVRDGVIVLRTEKSQDEISVTIPILPILAATLTAGPCADLAFICGKRGEPLTKETFGNMFSVACRKAGVLKSAHGVRKIGATRAAENGATVTELEALFAWRGGGMASLYTKAADRARVAKGAVTKLERRATVGAGRETG